MDEPAGVAETHSAVVFFVGDMAYKMKKAVDLGFLDFRTREQRAAACHREVALNRRLAPDVYRGVADVVGPDGEICEHLVVMRRMPADRRLSTLATAGADVDHHLRAIARVVAAFHASAPQAPDPASVAGRDAVLGSWLANHEELRRFAGTAFDESVLDRVVHLATSYLGGRDPLFAGRITEGWVRDGHGDLLADDIFCLDDGPRILDCLEFDDRLRYGDILIDAAFLAMDLERLGKPDLGSQFLERWAELGGWTFPGSLADHYIAYRAQVRAKVSCLRAEQQGRPDDRARALLSICLRHLERARVRLVLVGGLPGTGKSTLAAGLAESAGFDLLRSDEIRKELAGMDAREPAEMPFEAGIYSPERTGDTYEVMLQRAGTALSLGESVILDASWTDGRWRRMAAELASSTAAELVELRCDVGAEVAARRMIERAASGRDPSDATPAIARSMAAAADPWPEATVVDTSRAPSSCLADALAAVGIGGA